MTAIQNIQLPEKFPRRIVRPRNAAPALDEEVLKMRVTTTCTRLLLAIALSTVGPLLLISSADAKITKVQITTRETPTFGGYAWPGVGQYEKIVGIAFGEVDPTHPQNALITDIALAPTN